MTIFTVEDLATLLETVQYRKFHYERINYSLHSSPDEKMEAKKALKKFYALELKLEKGQKEFKTNEH